MDTNQLNQLQPLDWEKLKTLQIPTIVGVVIILLIAVAIFLMIPLKEEAMPGAFKTTAEPATLTNEEKEELLQQLSAPPAEEGKKASQPSDEEKEQILQELSAPASSAPALSDEEKEKLLQSLSAPSKP